MFDAKIVVRDLSDGGVIEILCLKEEAEKKAKELQDEHRECGIDVDVKVVYA
jgi:hypothetical protein